LEVAAISQDIQPGEPRFPAIQADFLLGNLDSIDRSKVFRAYLAGGWSLRPHPS